MRIIITNLLLKYKLNYDILEGEDGSDLINLVLDDTENLIKIIFTDENMTEIEGSDAIRAIKEIKENNCIKIISITSLEDEHSVSKIIQCGADRVLRKPANRVVLEEVFSHYLGSMTLVSREQ
jgi:response regulator RpfG family c-di-GMP phosphodiesterase